VSDSAPGGPFVAVLSRRGRFITAEPLFAAPPSRGSERSRSAGGIVVGQARSSRASMAGAGEGDVVLVSPARRGSNAKVLRRIGRPDVARDVIEALLHDRGQRRDFGKAVEEEARAAGARVSASRDGRRDLLALPTFTIDPVSARDFDDAISAEAIDSERVRVWVHIADVAAHVREGSKLDREARRRATSVYAPGTVEPMLPHALSSDACSLRPGLERAAVTVELELNDARVEKASFYRSWIRSDERLDYEQVDRIFAGSESARAPWAEPLAVARGAAEALGRMRASAGALVLDSPEPEFAFDERGHVSDVRGQSQTESHRLIEHLMVTANEAVARFLAERKAPTLYRVHERPEPARVERLVDQLASLEVPTPPLPEPMSSTQAAELLGEISAKVADHVARQGGRGRIALGSLVLRSLKQAYYSPVNLGHAGLHSTAYCHFTSPIRRYPDIVCHRALLAALGESEHAPRAEELGELGAWTSEREREAMVLERDADDVASCFALERLLRRDGPGQVLEGEVTGLIAAGAFVAFAGPDGHDRGAPPFEGMLPVRLMRPPRKAAGAAEARAGGAPRGGSRRGGRRDAPRSSERAPERDWWELNEEGTILRAERSGATVALGSQVHVRVARIDAVRGRVDLEPAG
jgi:ribonuclease R